MGFDDEDRGKYAGFKVHWDKDVNTFVFDTKEERDRWQIKQYGKVRNCFRDPDEPVDEQPVIVYRDPFWKDEDERLRYERAVKAAPPSQYGKMQLHEYLAEIVKLAEGIKPQGDAVKAMASGPWEER